MLFAVNVDLEHQKWADEEPPVSDAQRQKCTVFVSNLNYSLSEVHLRDVLSAAGDIREVRLALNNAGTSRGFGYVEFKSEASSLAT